MDIAAYYVEIIIALLPASYDIQTRSCLESPTKLYYGSAAEIKWVCPNINNRINPPNDSEQLSPMWLTCRHMRGHQQTCQPTATLTLLRPGTAGRSHMLDCCLLLEAERCAGRQFPYNSWQTVSMCSLDALHTNQTKTAGVLEAHIGGTAYAETV